MWRIDVEGFDPSREREVEAWLTVSNGRTGTRGSLEEGGEHCLAVCYVAGIYGKPDDRSVLPLIGPDWTALEPRLADEVLALSQGTILEHRRVLDLRHGMLFRFWRHLLPSGRETELRTVRFASLAQRDLMALEAELRADAGPVRLAGSIPLPVDVAIADAGAKEQNGHMVFEVVAVAGGSASFAISTSENDGHLQRLVTLARATEDSLQDEPAAESLARAEQDGINVIRERHCAAWQARWDAADVVVEGDAEAQRALRFSLYHLISAGDPESELSSIGARALTGPGYDGHVFWDTDVFVLPFFTYTHPETARALLGYRYRRLPAARNRAAALGYRGALFAWESADSGEDVTPSWVVGPEGTPIHVLTGEQEHHISADIAWAAWRYWQATGDDAFFREMGAEIILETARFWASRARARRDGHYHIGMVIGPDEYHEGVHDNAFTNVMARWNLQRGLDVADRLREDDPRAWQALAGRLALSRKELERWRAVSEKLVDGFDPETLLYEQFGGFFDLEDVNAAKLARRPYAGDVVLAREHVQRTQLLKQADVLMLPVMLPEVVPSQAVLANYRYYEPRTSHGSSLSPAIHALVAARIGELEDALEYFDMAASIDLGDAGSSALGIHAATLGGLWQAATFGFGGVYPDGDCLRVDPRLPRKWQRLCFPLAWRGGRVEVDCDHEEVHLTLSAAATVALGSSSPRALAPGRYVARGEPGSWAPLTSG